MLVLQQVVHSSSVDIRPEWAVVEQIPFTSLSKLNYQVKMPSQSAVFKQNCSSLIAYSASCFWHAIRGHAKKQFAQHCPAAFCALLLLHAEASSAGRQDWHVRRAERPLALQAPPPDTLETYGALEYFDKAFDRVTPKTEKPLRKTRRAFRNVTTSDDPVIRQGAATEAPPLLQSRLSHNSTVQSCGAWRCSPRTQRKGHPVSAADLRRCREHS